MISEGSCDTEDWSNAAENVALHHIKQLQVILNIVSHCHCICKQINVALASITPAQPLNSDAFISISI